ncbi:MAG: pilin [Minisyncoccia bacterium]
MRSRITFFVFLFVVGSFVLPHVAHAEIPFFKSIIPEGIRDCPLGWGALIIVVNNIISFLITIAIVFVAPVMIAYAGFKLVINQGDPGKVTEAKKILTSTIAGVVIALGGYSIVSALMAALYNQKAEGLKNTSWESIINSGDQSQCLDQKGVTSAVTTGAGVEVVTAPVTGQSYYEKHPDLLNKDLTGKNWTQEEIDKLYTGAGAMTALKNAGIKTNRGYGVVGQDCGTSCTSLNGMPKMTINTLVDAKNKCQTCAITVTGGTEEGHLSQGFGKASVDLRYDENTYNYLTTNGDRVVREAPVGDPVCGTSDWKCYSHVTAKHMSLYTPGGTVI